MAHQLETWANGSASFVSAREHAWHRLGTVLPERFDAAQAMQYAKLGGWNVRKESLTTTVITGDGVSTLSVPDQFASVRTNPVTGRPEVLGVVGRGADLSAARAAAYAAIDELDAPTLFCRRDIAERAASGKISTPAL